jgi:hypothetical protein
VDGRDKPGRDDAGGSQFYSFAIVTCRAIISSQKHGVLPAVRYRRRPLDRDHCRDSAVRRPVAFGQAGGDACPIGFAAVLAHLSFRVEARDGHAKSDDSTKLRLDEVSRGVSDSP